MAVEELHTAKFIGFIVIFWSTVRDFCRGSLRILGVLFGGLTVVIPDNWVQYKNFRILCLWLFYSV
jgi:hypothetical protein